MEWRKRREGKAVLKRILRQTTKMSSKARTSAASKKKASSAGSAAIVAVESEAAPVSLLVEETPVAIPAPKKARSSNSKKTPPIVAVVSPAGITGSFLSEQRPLIAHLPVSTAAVAFESSNLLKTEPAVQSTNTVSFEDGPKPFDVGTEEMSYLEGVKEGAGVESDSVPLQARDAPAPVAQSSCKLPVHYSEKLMVLFQDSNRYQKLPEKTEIACFWCCHGFSSMPCAIPSHILDEVWHMYGNFCSPECAVAYLFKERIDSVLQWERYALLNSLYARDAEVPHGGARGVRPAPPREVLRMFGGSMDISEYRAAVHEKRLRIDVLTPPMVSIIQTMDTKPIDFYDQNLKNVFIRNDIQHKFNAPGAQGLRLRRSKPVKSRESTVEWAMQIQQVGGGGH